MLFNSIQFLLFFPVVVMIFFVIPQKIRYLWLLGASYYFYMCWNPKYAILIAASTIITYASGMLIHISKKASFKKCYVALSFTLNLSILFFYKYFDMAFDAFNRILSIFGIIISAPAFDIILPVGISFYTFQALSYTMDIYREEIQPERNILRYALFISFFPQLVAGPIERSKNLLHQLRTPKYFNYQRVKAGLLLMLYGLFQKLIIADRVALLVNEVFDHYEQYAGLQIALAAVLFAFQIYCDFGGYSNIAIGAAEVMGFNLMENFHQPYFANSVKDFWRRWHISLSTWFRDYLYIPLGGNRKGKVRKYANTMAVFLVSGLWHGASWNYVVWGGLHGLYQIAADILKPLKDRGEKFFHINTQCASFRLFQRLVTFLLVDFAWIFFRANGTVTALKILRNMFSSFNLWILTDGSLFTLGLDAKDFGVAVIALAALFIIDYLREHQIRIRTSLNRQNLIFRWSVYYAIIFGLLIFGIYGSGYDASQFIYFQF